MKKLILVALIVCVSSVARAAFPTQTVQISTNAITARQKGTAVVAGMNVSTITVNNQLLDASLSSGTSGYAYTSRGSSLGPQWLPVNSVSVGGSTGQIQYNNSGSLGGIPSVVTASSVTISTVTAIHGTITNDAAVSGYVGQYIESVVSAVNFPTSTQFGDATSIILTAGDWDVTALAVLDGSHATQWGIGITPTSGNDGTGTVVGSNYATNLPSNAATDVSTCIPAYRVSLASTTTYYLKMTATWTVTVPTIFARLSARRVR